MVCAEVLFTGSLERYIEHDGVYGTTRGIGARVLAAKGVGDEVLRLCGVYKDTDLVERVLQA